MTGTLSHRPGAVLGGASLLSALGVTGLAAPSSVLALGCCVVGVVALTVGLTRNLRGAIDLGGVGLLGSVVVLALASPSVPWVLGATAGALLAWSFGTGAFAFGATLRGGRVERTEAVHATAVTAVTGLVTGVAVVTYRSVTVGPSVPGVALLLVGATTLGLALRG